MTDKEWEREQFKREVLGLICLFGGLFLFALIVTALWR